MEKETLSTKVRNYAIAGVCLGFVFLAGGVALKVFAEPAEAASVWSQCEGDSANVFIGTSDRLNGVECIALDREFFAEPEIKIGDIQKNSEEVCRFRLSKNTTEPLRFEVRYNGRIRTEVCNWQNFAGGGVD